MLWMVTRRWQLPFRNSISEKVFLVQCMAICLYAAGRNGTWAKDDPSHQLLVLEWVLVLVGLEVGVLLATAAKLLLLS